MAFCLSVWTGDVMSGILVIEIDVTWWKSAICVICNKKNITFNSQQIVFNIPLIKELTRKNKIILLLVAEGMLILN